MKIKIGEKVYLQKYEVAYMMHKLSSMPGSIFDEIFGGDEIFFMSSAKDGFRFDCRFVVPKNVKWLMEQDWIVDYDKYTETPIHELEATVERLRVERSAEIAQFNNQDDDYRRQNYKQMNDKFNKSGHVISSFDNLIAARRGKIKFVFPEEYEHKDVTNVTSTIKKKLCFLTRLFSHSAQ